MASARLSRALPLALERDGLRLEAARGRLARTLPAACAREQARLEGVRSRLAVVGGGLTGRFDHLMRLAAARLHDLSPLAVLGRGYAIARDGEGAVVRDVEAVAVGERLAVSVANGELDCRIEEKRRIDAAVVPWEE